MNYLKKAELLGILFTVAVGSLFHFTYDWSNQNPLVGLFSAVNESTWEHLKLLFFPYILYGIMEYFFVQKKPANFWTSKALGVLAGLLSIPVLFYTYQIFTGQNYAFLDISIFVIGVLIAFLVSYLVQTRTSWNYPILSVAILLILTWSFFLYTYFPPDCFLFVSP